jgi:hypothetical protein
LLAFAALQSRFWLASGVDGCEVEIAISSTTTAFTESGENVRLALPLVPVVHFAVPNVPVCAAPLNEALPATT